MKVKSSKEELGISDGRTMHSNEENETMKSLFECR